MISPAELSKMQSEGATAEELREAYLGSIYQPSTQVSNGAVGGGLTMGGIHLPSSIGEFVESTLLTPAIGGVGSVVSGISKFTLPIIAGGAGLLGGLLFGGGQEQQQEQEQVLEQAPVVTPTQDTTVTPFLKTLLDMITDVTQTQRQQAGEVDITDVGFIGGSVASPISTATTYSLTQPYTYNLQYTLTAPTQTTTTITEATQEAKQEATQTSSSSLWLIALVGGIALLLSKKFFK